MLTGLTENGVVSMGIEELYFVGQLVFLSDILRVLASISSKCKNAE